MKTRENLMKAFAGESQANRKYLAFARKAAEEGYERLARLFTATAEAETIHALKHLEIMGKVGNSAENAQAARDGEIYEFTEMYPEFLETARQEGEKAAVSTFHLANEAEKSHAELFGRALESLRQQQDIPAEKFYLCPVCGYLVADEAPEKCPVCGTRGTAFKEY